MKIKALVKYETEFGGGWVWKVYSPLFNAESTKQYKNLSIARKRVEQFLSRNFAEHYIRRCMIVIVEKDS